MAYIGEKLEKNGVFSIERKLIANNEKAGKFWSLEVMPSRGYVSSFLVNGGVLNPFEFESSTLTIVVQQIIALKTTKSKFYVATPYAALIFTLGMASIIMMKVPYQPWVRIPVWDSLETRQIGWH
jgi:hypothetical protein